MTDRPLLRLPRAAMFAAVCVALAAAGHGLMAGRTAPPWALGVSFLTLFALAVVGARRERSLGAIVGGMLAAQLGLHLFFDTAAGQVRPTAGSLPPDLAQLLLCGGGGAAAPTGPALLRPFGVGPAAIQTLLAHAAATSGAAGGHPMASMSEAAGAHAHTSGLGMLVAHVAAALMTAWWLRRGEAAVYALARWVALRALNPLRRLLALFGAAWLVTDAPTAPARQRNLPPAGGATLRHVVVRRGPPCAAPA